MLYRSLALLLLVCSLAHGEELNQFTLIGQHDWSAKKGLFLVLDNRYSGQPSSLSKLGVTLAIGDGRAWHIRGVHPTLAYGKTYRTKFTLDGQTATLWLDDQQIEQFPAGLEPAGGGLFAFDSAEWARRPAEYLVIQKSLRIETGGKSYQIEARGPVDPKRFLFNPGAAQERDDIRLTTPLTVEAVFEIQPYPEIQKLSPLVDAYGQVNFASWPGKVTSDQQLRQALAEEDARLKEWEKQLPPQDAFGGRTDLGWKEQASGFFRTIKRDGRWWLISPEGNPCFFTGICNAPALTWDATPVSRREFMFESLPPRDGVHKPAWGPDYWGDANTMYVAPQAANLVRQFGDDWREKATQLAIRRVRAWGFSGMGKWTYLPQQTKLPVLNRNDVPNLIRHPDTFDPETRNRFREVLAKQIAPQEKDPCVIGFSLGNEMDEGFTADEVKRILDTEDGASAAKKAIVEYALDKLFAGDAKALAAAWNAQGESAEQLAHQKLAPRPQDIEPLRTFLAENYFGFVYRTVKELAPNHLYFGHWILPTYWTNENDWRHIAPYCDVVGFDLYEDSFDEAKVQSVIRETDKPVFCGEFGFPPFWNGERGYGRFRTATADETEAGQRYAQWIKSAAANPWCIGVSVFQYRDQPVTGRGPVRGATPAAVHGENYAFGMVDITNQPKWPLLEQVRQANLSAANVRMGR